MPTKLRCAKPEFRTESISRYYDWPNFALQTESMALLAVRVKSRCFVQSSATKSKSLRRGFGQHGRRLAIKDASWLRSKPLRVVPITWSLAGQSLCIQIHVKP